MIAYRIQDRKRGVEYLLDPETQYSWPMDYDESKIRHGVSGCEPALFAIAYLTARMRDDLIDPSEVELILHESGWVN